MILPKSKWPKYLLKFKEIKGISYGKCKIGDQLVLGHAHCYPNYRGRGWICLRNKSTVRNRLLMLHEVAHLLVGAKNNHNDVWRRALLRIGGTLDPFLTAKHRETIPYHKKSRK